MTNGTVLLWKADLNSHRNWFRKFVSKCIIYFTKSDFTHVAVYVRGVVYESTIWAEKGLNRNGARICPYKSADVLLELKEPMTDEQAEQMENYCQLMVGMRTRYNFLKLLSLTWIYPTRALWNWLGWVPFDVPFVYGEVCSGFVDDAFMYADIDLFPDEHEGYTVPGDFVNSPLLKSVE